MLKLCKFSLSMLFINLYIIFALTGNYIPYGTLIFGLGSGLFMILDALNSGDFRYFSDIKPEMYTLICFTIWVFVTAPLAFNSSASLTGAANFLQKLVFVFVIYYICRKDGSLKFVAILFLVIAISAALIMIFMQGIGSKRMQLSENISINSTGNLMVLGTFCALYLYKGEKWYSFSALIGAISLFLFIIALTGSRKSFFAVMILIALFAVIMPKKPFVITAKSFFSFIVLAVLVYILFVKVTPMLSDTSLYARLFDERVSTHANESNEGRILLYQYAWNDFEANPIVGLGIEGYVSKHGSYTHSAYMEVLACTGVLGAILYFTSYVRTLGKLWKKMLDKTVDFFTLRKNRLVFCFFIVFLYIGLGIGHIYDNLSMLKLGMFIAAGCELTASQETLAAQEGDVVADVG